MAYVPRFTINPALLAEVGQVAALRERIQDAVVDLAWIPWGAQELCQLPSLLQMVVRAYLTAGAAAKPGRERVPVIANRMIKRIELCTACSKRRKHLRTPCRPYVSARACGTRPRILCKRP